MPELSPAAQLVLAAMRRSYDHEPTRRAIAADVLEALADQVVPPLDRLGLMHPAARDETQAIRRDILAIAAQLRGDTTQPQPPAP